MLKKTITYVDYDGNERTEDFFFNLTKAEAMEMTMSKKGGYERWVKEIIDAQDTEQLVKIFKEIILKSYGKKSLDGRRFIKSPELSEEFSQTEAFSDLFMELATDSNAAAEFLNGIAPQMPKEDEAGKTVPALTQVNE